MTTSPFLDLDAYRRSKSHRRMYCVREDSETHPGFWGKVHAKGAKMKVSYRPMTGKFPMAREKLSRLHTYNDCIRPPAQEPCEPHDAAARRARRAREQRLPHQHNKRSNEGGTARWTVAGPRAKAVSLCASSPERGEGLVATIPFAGDREHKSSGTLPWKRAQYNLSSSSCAQLQLCRLYLGKWLPR